MTRSKSPTRRGKSYAGTQLRKEAFNYDNNADPLSLFDLDHLTVKTKRHSLCSGFAKRRSDLLSRNFARTAICTLESTVKKSF